MHHFGAIMLYNHASLWVPLYLRLRYYSFYQKKADKQNHLARDLDGVNIANIFNYYFQKPNLRAR